MQATAALPIALKAVLGVVALSPIIGLAVYKMWGWVSLGVGLWLLFALILS
jgi:hypothetical protein